ncbi:MAG: ParB N-terminal domain-containing protein [Desulfomonilaceae bacterium]
MEQVNPNKIKTDEPFSALLPINDDLLKRIETNIQDDGYDESQPIILCTWDGQDEPVCIDGHTRLKACMEAGIETVPVFIHKVKDSNEALMKAIQLQTNRRNLTDGDLFRLVKVLDEPRSRGGDRRSEKVKSTPSTDGNGDGRSASAKRTANILGTSSRKVEKARTVAQNGTPEIIAAVENNKMTINAAYRRTRAMLNGTEQQISQVEREDTFTEDALPSAPEEDSNVSTSIPEDSVLLENPLDGTTVVLQAKYCRAMRVYGGSLADHVNAALGLYFDSKGIILV